MSKKRPTADSGKMRGYFAILNPYGAFWSHTVHESEAQARAYVLNFWRGQHDVAEDFLRRCKIIEVRVRLEPLDTSAGEAGTATTPQSGVVHEHAVPEGGDAQTPTESA